MIIRLLIGVLAGLGLWLALRGAFPSRRSLQDQLARFEASSTRSRRSARQLNLVETMAVRLMYRLHSDPEDDLLPDLAVTGKDEADFAMSELTYAIGGMVTAILSLSPLWITGLVGLAELVLFSALALGFYYLPDVELARLAARRREEFSESLTVFVDLVALTITGGGGTNTAMRDAASIGQGWVFETLSRSIDRSVLRGDPPWASMEELGRTLKVEPLIELAGALALAGNSGAHLSETLQGRAESGRERQLAQARGEAERSTEAMTVPLAVLVLAMVAFMGYPAVVGLLGL